MICRAIKKRNGDIYICPEQLESITENPLTAEQQLIVELDDRVTELEQQNKQMFELLIEYLKSDFGNGTDNLTVKNQELIRSVTGKKIEEVLK